MHRCVMSKRTRDSKTNPIQFGSYDDLALAWAPSGAPQQHNSISMSQFRSIRRSARTATRGFLLSLIGSAACTAESCSLKGRSSSHLQLQQVTSAIAGTARAGVALPTSPYVSSPTQLQPSQKDSCRSPGALAESHLCRQPAVPRTPALLQGMCPLAVHADRLPDAAVAVIMHGGPLLAYHRVCSPARVTELRGKSSPGTSCMRCCVLSAPPAGILSMQGPRLE